MAGNSFLLKGWTVTLTGGLLALTFDLPPEISTIRNWSSLVI
jgi:hypothetical protein